MKLRSEAERPVRHGPAHFFGAGGACCVGVNGNVEPLPPVRGACCCPLGAGEAGAPAGTGLGSVVLLPPEAGWLLAGALVRPLSCSTVVLKPPRREATMDSESDVIMKTIAETVVAFESSVAEPRGPNAVCDPIPPNAPARSAAFPLWSRTTIIRKKQTRT